MNVPPMDLIRPRHQQEQVISRRETFGATGTYQLPRMRHNSISTQMEATQKKTNRPSNIGVLIQDFQRLRTDIKNMQTSHQRIVDKIRDSYETTKTTHIISEPPSGLLISEEVPFSRTFTFPRQKSPVNELTTNYRFQVEEVHQLKGFDQAYQIKSLENALKQLNRRLEEEMSEKNHYQFQVWLLRDILKRHGIRVADDGTSHEINSRPTKLDSIMKEMKDKFQNELQKQIKSLELKYQQQITVQIQRIVNLNAKIRKVCRSAELEQKDKLLANLRESYEQRSKQLQSFRQQVGGLIEQVNAESSKKASLFQQQITDKEHQILELRESLRKKAIESPRKKDELSQLRDELNRLTRLIVEMNTELEMKDEKLAENEVKLIEMRAQIEHQEMENVKLQKQLEEVRRVDWPSLPPTRLDNSLDRSHQGIEMEVQCNLTDESIIEGLKSKITGLQFELSMLRVPTQIPKMHSSQFENKIGISDRKMYKSVLNVALVDQSKDSRLDSRLDSKIPRSKRFVSLLRDQEQNRKSQNNFSKVTGFKELSLNLSVEEEGPKPLLDIEQMIRMPEYPFESLKMSHGDTVYLLMKMAQIIRWHRDELKQKQRLLMLLRRRLDTTKDFIAERESTVLTSNIIQEPFDLSDYAERYSQRRDVSRRPCQWQTLERESMQAIQRLLSQIESLQAEIQKSQKNQINLIEMKEIYKEEIQKLKKENQHYATYYKQEVRRLTQMIEQQQQGTNMQAIRSLVWEILKTTEGKTAASQNHKEYVRLLKQLLSLPEDIT